MTRRELGKTIESSNYSEFIKSRFFEALRCKELHSRVVELLNMNLSEKDMLQKINYIATMRVETIKKNGRVIVKYWPVIK